MQNLRIQLELDVFKLLAEGLEPFLQLLQRLFVFFVVFKLLSEFNGFGLVVLDWF
jgi:hypothetical protein